MDKFELSVSLGGAAMNCPQDVAALLSEMSDALEFIGMDDGAWITSEGKLRDDNGNTVGSWRITNA